MEKVDGGYQVALKFKDYLAMWLTKKQCSRKELIALLQKRYYPLFSGLDAVTVCRWLNGKTVPKLNKQLCIAQCLQIDIVDFLLTIHPSTIRPLRKEELAHQQLTRAFNSSLSPLSYNQLYQDNHINVCEHSYQKHISSFGDFYRNISALRPFLSELYRMRSEVRYRSTVIRNPNRDVLGHWAGIMNIEKINNLPSFISLPPEQVRYGLVIMPGFYACAQHHLDIILHSACLYLTFDYKEKDTAYIFVVEYPPILHFYKTIMRAKEVKYYPPLESRDKMGVYLLQFDIMEAISSPFLFPKIQEQILVIQKADEMLQ